MVACKFHFFLAMLVVFSCLNGYTQSSEFKTYSDDTISFSIPETVMEWKHTPQSKTPTSKDGVTENAIYYRVVYRSISSLKDERPWMLSDPIRQKIERNEEVTEKYLSGLLEEKYPFVLLPYHNMGTIMYVSSTVADKNVEEEFTASFDGLLAPTAYNYSLSFLNNGYIVTVNLMLKDGADHSIAQKAPRFFRKKNDYWFWSTRDSPKELIEMMIQNNSKTVPRELRDLQKSWDVLKSTITFK